MLALEMRKPEPHEDGKPATKATAKQEDPGIVQFED